MKNHSCFFIFIALMMAACCRVASCAIDSDGAPLNNQDALPVRELPMTADVPLPDAALTWTGGVGQCFVLNQGTAIRREKLDDWNLERSLDLMQSMGVTEIYWSHRNFTQVLHAKEHPQKVLLPEEFDHILAEAARRGMTVGLFLNWNEAEIDLNSRAYRQTMHILVDALSAKKRQHPNLTSLWWDEIWCAMGKIPIPTIWAPSATFAGPSLTRIIPENKCLQPPTRRINGGDVTLFLNTAFMRIFRGI